MKPLWHPLSALLLDEPRAFATPVLLKFLLAARGRASLLYAGDAMWPAVAHGDRLEVVPLGVSALRVGDAVVASVEGIPDLFRVAALPFGGAHLVGDAEPGEGRVLPIDSVLARASLPRRKATPLPRAARRAWLEAKEALHDVPSGSDPARSVHAKYDHQAVFYARGGSGEMAPALREAIAAAVPRGGRILVAGSGAGKESIDLARAGWSVKGVDFSTSMVEASRQEASAQEVEVDFEQADLRSHEEPAGSLAAILFTYEVYSFLPGRAARVGTLSRMRRWLADAGVVFLSARRVASAYERAILTLQHGMRGPGGEWGDSHTRWISSTGELHRSFLRIFTDAGVASEAREAGFEIGAWEGGHAMLTAESR